MIIHKCAVNDEARETSNLSGFFLFKRSSNEIQSDHGRDLRQSHRTQRASIGDKVSFWGQDVL
jgi:hypothetical protein